MLELRDVTFGFEGRPALYRDLSLSFAPHERVGLSAPSGFGKTTLCRLLAGYLQPTCGRVLLDGAPLPRRGACPVQLIGQHPERAIDRRLTMRTVLEEAGTPDPQLAASLGIREEWMGRRAHELSGGELQRFCIARTLAANPRYVVADEISTMLDALTQARLWRFLLDWCDEHGSGLVFVSHSPALTARLGTRVVDLTALPR